MAQVNGNSIHGTLEGQGICIRGKENECNYVGSSNSCLFTQVYPLSPTTSRWLPC